MPAIGGHHRGFEGRTNEWLTPPELIRSLGEFDLDPCSPVNRPWDTARRHYTIEDDGLMRVWEGRVWLNPPYGPHTKRWMERLSSHGDGIALIFARTETAMFFRYGWERADAMLFLRGRLQFHRPDGQRETRSDAGGPSVLIAYGERNVRALRECGLSGQFVPLGSDSR